MAQQEQHTAANAAAGEQFIRRRKLSRVLAMQYLYACEVGNTWEKMTDDIRGQSIELAQFLETDEENYVAPSVEDMKEAWKYAAKLINGICDCREELDERISQAAINWKISRMGAVDRAILRLAIFEMLKVEKVKVATAIDEAVELAKVYGQGDSPRFINGLLDKVRRMAEAAASPAETNEQQD